MNAGHAESFVYVHYNHRLLRRCREDYEGLCKNWNDLIFDDNLKIDMIAVEDTEYALLCAHVLMTSMLQKVARHLLCHVKLKFRDHLVCR